MIVESIQDVLLIVLQVQKYKQVDQIDLGNGSDLIASNLSMAFFSISST